MHGKMIYQVDNQERKDMEKELRSLQRWLKQVREAKPLPVAA